MNLDFTHLYPTDIKELRFLPDNMPNVENTNINGVMHTIVGMRATVSRSWLENLYDSHVDRLRAGTLKDLAGMGCKILCETKDGMKYGLEFDEQVWSDTELYNTALHNCHGRGKDLHCFYIDKKHVDINFADSYDTTVTQLNKILGILEACGLFSAKRNSSKSRKKDLVLLLQN
jgi:hypothetical protein